MTDAEWSKIEGCRFWEYLPTEIKIIFGEVHQALLLQTDGEFFTSPNCLCQNNVFKSHPLLRHMDRQTFRNNVLGVAGLTTTECASANEKPLQGPLSDLRASNIYIGPFRIEKTSDPASHLLFHPGRRPPVILVLDTATICKLAILDLTEIMAYKPPSFRLIFLLERWV